MDFSSLTKKRVTEVNIQPEEGIVSSIVPEAVVNSEDSVPDNTVQVMFPHLDKSMVMKDTVDAIFNAYSLASLCTDYFGSMLGSCVPSGYDIERHGKFKFLVKYKNTVTPVTMTALANDILKSVDVQGSARIPLTVSVKYTDDLFSMLLFTAPELAAIAAYRPDIEIVESIPKDEGVLSEYYLVFRKKA